ncbi:hypothetical protein [Dasania marina]|uniref:hypothetical protein n=1 Tax=Dasania marina TaxID=471499 RepID=UPI0003813DC5|nr:hypothetical protein [Dasania marina]
MRFKKTLVIASLLIIAGCSPDNEHFCARYEYVYAQLNDPELPSYGEMKQALQIEISQKPDDNDQQRFMLFVLEEYHLGIKQGHQTPREFCMATERWQYYDSKASK